METMEQIAVIAESIENGQWKQASDQLVELMAESGAGYADLLEILFESSSMSSKDLFRFIRTVENNNVLTFNGERI